MLPLIHSVTATASATAGVCQSLQAISFVASSTQKATTATRVYMVLTRARLVPSEYSMKNAISSTCPLMGRRYVKRTMERKQMQPTCSIRTKLAHFVANFHRARASATKIPRKGKAITI